MNTYHCVLTVQWQPRRSVLVTNTWADCITLPPGSSRADAWDLAFTRLRAQHGIPADVDTMGGLAVLFFSVEPALLPVAEAGRNTGRTAGRP